MNPQISASKGGKTTKSASGGGSNPFDEVTAHEEKEQKRIQIELEAMQREKDEVSSSLKDREAKAEEELKEEAKNELIEFREEELAPIVKAAEVDAKKETAALEKMYDQKEESAFQYLQKQMLQMDFPSGS